MSEGEQDRADRLSRRRKDRAQSDETDNTVKTDNTDETEEDGDTVNPSKSVSLTESRKEQMMHLPEDQHKELHHVYNRLKADYEYEFGEDFEMNRHYFPLLLQYGLEQIEKRDLENLQRDLSPSEESS